MGIIFKTKIESMADAQTTDYEEALMKTVDDIWADYDKDGNGVLDKTEMRAFVEATITQSGINKTVTDEEFNQIFQQFDLDQSTTIEKDEMAVFVKRMAGF